MHDTALAHAEAFFALYGTSARNVLDFGSRYVNGSVRTVLPDTIAYTGVDCEPGRGVDVVVPPGGLLPFDDLSFDLVTSTSCLEHDPCFWETFLELVRVLSAGAYLYLNVPSNGRYHRHPVDCWRFYPDAGLALERWARRKGFALTLVESFVASRVESEWNDAILVFTRDSVVLPRQFLADVSPRPVNVHRYGVTDDVELFRPLTEDQVLLQHFAEQAGHTIVYDDIVPETGVRVGRAGGRS